MFLYYEQNGMSLANKYRPIDFDTTIWQDHITSILKSKINNSQHNNYNYLFYGPRWTWKTSTARILSKAMNCLDLHDWNPCNKCANCQLINEWKTLDYVEIDAASYTWVDNIREEILSKTEYRPTQLKKKIYVIDEVHMLSKWAFNALLKTLEEPKDYMSFILATTEINKVPETIVSRCQIFNFKKVGEEEMVARLQYICEQENLWFEPEALKLISKISEWCVRDAVKYVDQVSIFGNINVQNVTSFLWIAWDNLIKEFLQTIKSWDRSKVFAMVDDISNKWIDLTQLTKQIIMYIDKNLTTDMDFLLWVSDAFGEINSTIKYYPYPNMIYKVALNRFMSHWVEWNNMSSWGSETTEGSNLDSSLHSEWQKNSEWQKDSSTRTAEQQKPQDNNTNSDLKSQLISKISSDTLKNQIKEFVYIKWIEWNTVSLIIINKIAELGINNNKKEIESVLWEILWRDIAIELEFQDKNEFFVNQL